MFGYAFLAFVAFNWKPLFNLLFSSSSVLDRFVYFDLNTNWQSLALYPLIFGVSWSVLYPWFNYSILWINRFAIDKQNSLQAASESKLIAEKRKLEYERNALQAQEEERILQQAKIDSDVKNIEDKDAQNEAMEKLAKLRRMRDLKDKAPGTLSDDDVQFLIRQMDEDNLELDSQTKEAISKALKRTIGQLNVEMIRLDENLRDAKILDRRSEVAEIELRKNDLQEKIENIENRLRNIPSDI